MARVRGGTVIYYVTRTILNVVRAIDTIIWGLIVIVWVGLGSFAGVLALVIHSIAALGKLFSEEIEHIDPGPVEAVEATGATLLQTIRFAVVPQVIPSFLSYTLLHLIEASVCQNGVRIQYAVQTDATSYDITDQSN